MLPLVAQHHSGAECTGMPSLEPNTTIIFISFVSSIASHHEKLVCGRAVRIRPRVCADDVESPDQMH